MGDDAPDHAEAFQNARRCERRDFTIFSGTVCNPRRNTTGYGDEAWRLGRIHHIGFNGTSPAAFAIFESSSSSLTDNSPCLYSNALDSTRTCDLQMVSNFSEEALNSPFLLIAASSHWSGYEPTRQQCEIHQLDDGGMLIHGRYMTYDNLGLKPNAWIVDEFLSSKVNLRLSLNIEDLSWQWCLSSSEDHHEISQMVMRSLWILSVEGSHLWSCTGDEALLMN